MRVRLASLAALALGAGFLAGCGGGESSSLPAGASIAPKNAPLFLSVVTKRGSTQWNQALALVRKFPGGKQALDQPMFKRETALFGDEVDLVWLDLQNSNNDLVGLTKPRNSSKFDAMVERDDSAHTVVDGWTVVAHDQALLQHFQQARKQGALSDNKAFKDGYGKLPGDALVKAFVSGAAIQKSLFEANSTLTGAGLAAGKQLDSITAALVPEQSGVKLTVGANGNLPGNPSTFSPELPSQLPSGALAYASFSNLESSLKSALQRASQMFPRVDAFRAQLETLGGFSVDQDLLPLFGGEGAVAVYPGQKQPAIDVVFKISDETAAKRVISGLVRLAQLSKEARVTTSGGVTQIQVSKTTTLSVTVTNGLLVVTNQASSISSIQGVTVKLADDPSYKAAVEGSGLPSNTSGFVYVNTGLAAKDILNAQAQQRKQRVNPAVLSEVSHLQGLLLYAHKNGGSYELTGFLGIK